MYRLVLLALLLSWSLAGAQPKPNVSFEWAFAVLSDSASEHNFVSITRDTTLQSGDQFKMMVQLKAECFVYVIYESPSGEISLKFPYDLKQFSNDYKVSKNYYIPRGREWFKLDNNIGRETIYLLASVQRLLDLEVLLSKYAEADVSKKQQLAKDIAGEIRNIRRNYRTFTTLAERPISIGGNVRSLTKAPRERFPDVAGVAIAISAENFYGKTFTIDHK
jgi:hypothetical protein